MKENKPVFIEIKNKSGEGPLISLAILEKVTMNTVTTFTTQYDPVTGDIACMVPNNEYLLIFSTKKGEYEEVYSTEEERKKRYQEIRTLLC